MVLILLIITSLFFVFISYIFSGKDIMSPSLLLSVGYFIASVSCFMNVEKWCVDLHINTYLIITLGIFAFFATEVTFNYIKQKNKKSKEENKEDCNEKEKRQREINISNIKIFICIIFNIVVAILYLIEIVRISGGYHGDFNEMMNVYKRAYSYGNAEVKSYVVQLMKISKGIGYTFLFIFFNNVFSLNKINIRRNLKYLVPSITYLLATFLIGGRLNMISFSVASIFLIFYNWNRKYDWKKHINKRFIKILCLSFLFFLVIFYYSKSIVGRITEKNFFEYITEYLGGSIQLFDEYLNSEIKINKKMETFPGIIQSLNKLKIINVETRKSLEFRHVIDGVYLGNIYTGLRRYYNDMGIFGVIFIQILYSTIFNKMYYRIKTKHNASYSNIFRIIFYSSNLFSIITQAMEDHFMIDLSVGFLVEIIIMYFILKLIINKEKLKKEVQHDEL